MGMFDFLNKRKSAEEKEKDEEKAKSITNAGLAGAAEEVVQRFGAANKEHLVAYGGVDNEAGQILTKSIKEESRRYYEQAKKIKQTVSDKEQAGKLLHQNLKSHAGFAAEIDDVALENSENIISKNPTRRIRMDDLSPEKGGQVNHPLYDHVDIDKNGNPIKGTESQMKIKGENADEALDKMMEKGKLGKDGKFKNEKYIDNDVKMKVQKDFADEIKNQKIPERIKSLEEQVKALEGMPGKEQDLQNAKRQIEKLKTLEKNIEASNVTNEGSKENITSPEIATAKKIANISHRAGVEAAKSGAAMAGGMSLVRNIVAIAKGDKEADEAALAVVKDTGTGAAVSYATAFAGSALKGGMQNAGNSTLRSLSKTNLPAQIVTASIDVGKTMTKYFRGDIDGVECLNELGEKGTGMVASTVMGGAGAAAATAAFGKTFEMTFGSIGTVVIPIPVVGTLIGSAVGYTLGTLLYSNLLVAAEILKEAKLAHEERIRIEAECAEAIAMIREYRAEMEKVISEYLCDHMEAFHVAFNDIKSALAIGDVDGFIGGANSITKKLGGTTQFNTFNEFDTFMQSSEAFKL
ncbi:hypothetical protein FACS1894163_01360 [Spirochaetia bacterium]|nr:hypothetical protein FACS1894163_01360 [Spirochaetia bacterium]